MDMKMHVAAFVAGMVLVVAAVGTGGKGPGPSSSDYEDSAFGIFGAFAANEYGYFKGRAGFDNDAYWNWTETRFRDLGAHWTRSNLQLVWDIVEPTVGDGYQWDNQMLTDSMIQRIYRPGNSMNWLGVFHEGGGPVAPRFPHANRPPLRNPLDYPDEYSAFVRAAVERYDGDGRDDAAPGVRVKYWQAGNEIPFWRDSGRTAQDYVRFVRLIREATRQADPESKIALIAPTQGFTVDPFIAEVIDELAAEKAFDVIDVHHWGNANNWKMTALPEYRHDLESKGLTDVQIWSCEHGTWQGRPSEQPVAQSEQDQARSLVKRYVYNLNNGLDKLFWNNLMEWRNFSGNPGSIFNSMGLVTDGQGPGEDLARFNTERVAYWSYKMLALRIDAPFAMPLGAVAGVYREGQVYAYAYRRKSGGKMFYILWSEVGPTQVSIPVTTSSFRLTGLIPDRFGHVLVERDLSDSDGKITFDLSSDPVTVEET